MRTWILFIIILLTGCKTLTNQSSPEYTIEPIKKSEFLKLNGKYYNYQDTVFGQIVHLPRRGLDENYRVLLDRLFVFFPNKAYSIDTVEIKFITNKSAEVIAYNNGTVFFNKNMRGRFKKGYYYLRPKGFVIPFFPIFYWHNFERIRLGKSGNDLVVDHTIVSWGFALFAGGSDKGLTTSIYKRINE